MGVSLTTTLLLRSWVVVNTHAFVSYRAAPPIAAMLERCLLVLFCCEEAKLMPLWLRFFI